MHFSVLLSVSRYRSNIFTHTNTYTRYKHTGSLSCWSSALQSSNRALICKLFRNSLPFIIPVHPWSSKGTQPLLLPRFRLRLCARCKCFAETFTVFHLHSGLDTFPPATDRRHVIACHGVRRHNFLR